MSDLNYEKNYIGIIDDENFPRGYDKYYWISDRCIEGIKWCQENNISYEVVPLSWPTELELEKAYEYISRIKVDVIEYAKDILNEYHQVDYSTEAWNIMLAAWLDMFLVSVYDKYLKLKYLNDNKIVGDCDIFEPDDIVPPLDYSDALSLMGDSEAYHLYQFSQVLKECGINFEHIHFRKTKFSRPNIQYVEKKSLDWKKQILKKIYWTYKKLFHIKNQVIIQGGYLPYKICLKAMLKRPGKITGYMFDYERDARPKSMHSLDYVWRNSKSFIKESNDPLTKLICRLLKKNLPIAYVEDFVAISQMATRTYGYSKDDVTVITDASGFFPNEVLKRFLMNIRDGKGTICSIQHGGGYGMYKARTMDSEYQICDKFYTWGGQYNDSKFVPMPVPKGFSVKNVNATNLDINKMLYVNYYFMKNICRLFECDYLHMKDVIEEERQFLFEVNRRYPNIIHARIFPNDYGWSAKKKLQECIPTLQSDNCLNYYESLAGAKLVIFDYVSTTMLEALIMDKPFIVRQGWSCIEKEAAEDFELLKGCGIMYDTFQDMLDAIDNIWCDVEKWWNEPSRKKIVNQFREKYAYFPENAEQLWLKEILSYL